MLSINLFCKSFYLDIFPQKGWLNLMEGENGYNTVD